MLRHRGLVTLLSIMSVPSLHAATITVDDDGPADFTSIQAGIDATDNGVADEVVVSPGTYFEGINFNGKRLILRSLSGDPSDTIIDGTGQFHVVQCVSGEESNTVLSGFTITGGNANGTGDNSRGGGMLNENGSDPTVINCVFVSNMAQTTGGGMCNDGSSPTVIDCTFSGNSSNQGGGVYNGVGNPIMTNCSFISNSALNGGGMYNIISIPMLTNCTFSDNTASGSGGGMHTDLFSLPTVTNCTFVGNSAVDGGGMYNFTPEPTTDWTVTNCTFSGNTASGSGGAMYNQSSRPTVTNCILWSNLPEEVFAAGVGSPTFSFSDVQDGLPSGTIDGGGNINIDPWFVDTDGPDDTFGTLDDDLRLQAGSPCIDAGDNTAVPVWITTDLAGRLRFVDDLLTPDTGNGTAPVVDMGAFEYICPGNLDDIPGTTLPDFALLALQWMETDCGTCGGADFTGDGNVMVDDALIQAADWLCGTGI